MKKYPKKGGERHVNGNHHDDAGAGRIGLLRLLRADLLM